MPGAMVGLLVAGALSSGLGAAFHHYVVRMSTARRLLTDGGVLVDVDTTGEFAQHHPRVAISIPLEELAARAGEIGARERPVVVFAHSWRRGARATRELRSLGFREVMNAAGLRTKEKLSLAARRAAALQDLGGVELAPHT